VPVYLIEREDLYDRPNLYGNAYGDYYDNLERFTVYAHGALQIAEALDFRPDVIHCNDWQSGLVPALLKGPYRRSDFFAGTPSVFTIHNLGYQGLFPAEKLPLTGLSREEFFHLGGLEYWGKLSLLKAGVVYSEAITTVSATYAQEIQTFEYGMGMEGILHHRSAFLHGILNGVDYRVWDPAVDPHLPAQYSPDEPAGKTKCKHTLMSEMNLDLGKKSRPLIGMISRLDTQKGLDLLVEILDEMLALDVGLVILGSGDERIQESLRDAVERYPGRVGLKLGFDEALAHRIMGGVDIFLIPSRYEPCGLTQMYALKYGTAPVVRATGGLADTIVAFEPTSGEGNGFIFTPYRAEAFLDVIRESVELFSNKKHWKKLMENGMKADFSWDRSAAKYLEVYQSIAARGEGLRDTE
jgi:starch synthase